MYSLSIIDNFRNLFISGNPYYGTFVPNKLNKEGKQKGKYTTRHGDITNIVIQDHLEGNIGLGIIPIIENKTKFFVIDIDKYEENYIKSIIDIIYKNNLPLVPFRSKSGGLHLYLFLAELYVVKDVIDLIETFLILLNLNKTEVFPKQTDIKGQVGSFINLPYFGETRKLINKDMEELEILEAIEIIRSKIISLEDLKEYCEIDLPLLDAPPCLQSLYMRNDTTFRNNYLFSIGVYYKAKFGDDFEHYLIDANNKLNNPLSVEEVNKSIINSHKRKSYSYKCKDEPLCSFCRKTVCRKRKYGISGTNISNINFDKLIQYMSDPPYYGWVVNGKELSFVNEAEIISQVKFREQCFRVLKILPNKLTDIKWTDIVNIALTNMEVKEIKPEDDISPGSLFKEYLVEFFENRAMAKTKEQIMLDRIYKDDSKLCYIFKPKNLISYLVHQKQFKYFGQAEIQVRLKEMGGIPVRYYINKEVKNIRVWSLPYKALEDFIEASTPSDVEFIPEDIFNEEEY